MKPIALAAPQDRADVFRSATEKHPLSPELIEKDFWVCWTLQRLFTLPEVAPHLLFKGGTTLSKAYKVIHRFSEDIDISVSREYIRPDAPDAVAEAPSRTKQRLENEALKSAFARKVTEVIYPLLGVSITEELGEAGWTLTQDENDAGTLLFHYPAGIEGVSEYNLPVVRIEMGGRSDTWPSELKNIIAYTADIAPDLVEAITIPVLDARRTFWEKATILHNEYYRPEGKRRGDRISRHYYDLAQLSKDSVIGPGSLASRDLMERVVEHKTLYYRDNWSCYDKVLEREARLVPPAEVIADLKSDYEKMRPMFFGEPPTFDAIVEEITRAERKINEEG